MHQPNNQQQLQQRRQQQETFPKNFTESTAVVTDMIGCYKFTLLLLYKNHLNYNNHKWKQAKEKDENEDEEDEEKEEENTEKKERNLDHFKRLMLFCLI